MLINAIGLKIRDQLDKPRTLSQSTDSSKVVDAALNIGESKDRSEQIAKNPLFRHTSVSIPALADNIAPIVSSSGPLVPTKLKETQSEVAGLGSVAGFTIFSDFPSIPKPLPSLTKPTSSVPVTKRTASGAKKEVSSAPAPLSLGFSIFEETKPTVADSVKAISSKAVKVVDNAHRKPLSQKQSTSTSCPQESEVAADALKKLPTSEVRHETPAVQETVADFDNEDSTINTKLARFDIDAMFFSPSASDSVPGGNSKNKAKNVIKGSLSSENGQCNAMSKSIRQQKALPLGVKVEELTGLKDLSAIKEA